MTEQFPVPDGPAESVTERYAGRTTERQIEHDVDALRDADSLRDSEERFRSAFEASPTGFALVELGGRFRAVNHSMSSLLGYSEAELLARTFRDVTHPEDLPATVALRDRLVAGEIEGFELEKRYLHKSGRVVWGMLTVSLVRDTSGRPAYTVAQVLDITARKEAEEALARHAAELERSNAELEEFAYVASHDLQRPLRTVGSYAQLLAERYGDRLDDRAERWIGYIVGGVGRMRQLVEDLLTLARVGMEGGAFVATDTGAVVARTWDVVRGQNGSDDATLVAGALPTILADPVQLEQLFQNLLGNALKYRRVDIPLRVHVAADRRTDTSVPCWEFTVSDNGIGFDMVHAERIFQIFQRLHREDEYEGTGIGLAICKKIVQRHGGRIWAVSAPGEGAAFHFTMREHPA